MFSKKEDNFLKFINIILILITVLSLGAAIGNNIYIQSDNMHCYALDIYSEEYKENCSYTISMSEDQSKKNMYIGYSLFATSLAGLLICNLFKKQ
ncbi:MAG: hypothetical protein IJO32_06970 [Bacilli bacterium]|nr:hypothetical protein [Bacilli bacterium]